MTNLLAVTSDSINLQPPSNTQFAQLGGLTVPSIVSALIRLTVVVAAIVFFFILVIGGIRWIASGGDKAQTEAARNQITAALVGLVIVFAAWAIVALINTFFKIDIFSLAIPSV
ncbi:MAG: hypothetical protein UT58_C0003G0029 [Microgenomates group bacterium GW2011_GWC1_39_7b]|uniref:Integral membrane protein n=3 Tax=Candidatus Woeseibacteriota TaxID=1752722 RepID=A0A0G0PS75_9BACT|nr:MAG: hypothetical protein UT17_C0003G0214 [Candidatus Woesebacteria bacterium GW2011_GWB1_39_10]KKR26951.1 MAG: hypothetical protein UT58_C0003G0029 [Microgenomates group bacterium GW2011_GWC1_39_7b]KKR72921.1 MAG: hypothetical protein UU16_C0035G0002 [Candidatus Woesebacteria bacterium GW2011_GWA2_40_7]KKS91151.1 MAG: hypothetical protein UV66_C0001G0508 [Candidatus Woesebacteria bacterium GW2011_GWA1_43_12]